MTFKKSMLSVLTISFLIGSARTHTNPVGTIGAGALGTLLGAGAGILAAEADRTLLPEHTSMWKRIPIWLVTGLGLGSTGSFIADKAGCSPDQSFTLGATSLLATYASYALWLSYKREKKSLNLGPITISYQD